MEHYFSLPGFYYGLCLFLVVIVHAVLRAKSRAGHKLGRRIPPGPWQLPLVGSLHHFVRGLPHHTMRNLSLRHGPVMLLRICEHVVIVASSAEAAKDILKGQDTAFEQRPSSPGIDELYSGGLGVIFSPYGEHWRLMRRILVTELLSARRVEAFRHIRHDEAARLVLSLASSPPGQLVNVDNLLEEFIADAAVRAIFGDRLPEKAAFLKMMKHGTDISSLFDLRDLFPSSRLVRMLPRGHKKEQHQQELSRLLDNILRHHEERKAVRDRREDERDMIDVLLRIQREGDMQVSLPHGVIKAVAMDVFGAALDTASITLQWAMAELIANPRAMEKAQQEIRHVLAGQKRVQEAALCDLRYLKAVVKETLRLHPPGPFVPRVCLDDNKKIQGYDVQRGTVVIINAWAISRDPKYWKDPDSFMPERFEDELALNFKGLDFEFTPFGAGRRICPGMNFAQANIETALAYLLYHFDWELPSGVKEIDMTESFGVTVKRKAQLLLCPIPRIPLVLE